MARSAIAALGFTAAVATPAFADVYAATLPGSRTIVVGTPSTVFATMLNTGAGALSGCSVKLVEAPAGLTMTYQTVTAANLPTGAVPNTTFAVPGANGSQGLLLAFSASAPFTGRDVRLLYSCTSSTSAIAATTPGVNTVFLTATAAAAPDIIPIALTATNDGAIRMASATGAGFVATAAVNIGPPATLVVKPNTSGINLGLVMAICETGIAGACVDPPTPQVTTSFPTNVPKTFSVFATATRGVAFFPDVARVRLAFTDASGSSSPALYGLTSVAVTAPRETPPTTIQSGVYQGLINGKPGFAVANADDGSMTYVVGQRGAKIDADSGLILLNRNAGPDFSTWAFPTTFVLGGADSGNTDILIDDPVAFQSNASMVVKAASIFPGSTTNFIARLVYDDAASTAAAPATLAAAAGTYDIYSNGVDIGDYAIASTGAATGAIKWPGATVSCPIGGISVAARNERGGHVNWRFVFDTTTCMRGMAGYGFAPPENGGGTFEVMGVAAFMAGSGTLGAGVDRAVHLTLVKR